MMYLQSLTRLVIRFLNAEGIQTSQICQRLKNIYGESCVSQKNIYKWVNESQRSAGKVLLTIFWDVDGPICLDFLSSRQRMNSDLYCAIVVNKLKPGIRNKRRGKLSKGVLFLHDNARPHTSCKTVSTIIKLGFEVLEHPAYSPDLAPSDYFLFGLLKKELKGKRFDSDEDVQKVVQDFFHTLPKSAYKEGIYKLPERWRRCIESWVNSVIPSSVPSRPNACRNGNLMLHMTGTEQEGQTPHGKQTAATTAHAIRTPSPLLWARIPPSTPWRSHAPSPRIYGPTRRYYDLVGLLETKHETEQWEYSWIEHDLHGIETTPFDVSPRSCE
ncbi:hypothetical protein LAZ67_14000382 [Cordylochernes scorpioides]|uniref:Transposase n=1 Tax=Cordylochernes scorpioides TaxID=51811 RepID=A0ABY6L9J8_9ARAC|nr:hypothetical protein LAZ67_14000382 [Cordylochernes scorpioides]